MYGEAALHRSLLGAARAHQHGAVYVGRYHQDTQQNRPNDGPLYTQIVRSTRYSETCQIRVSTSAHTFIKTDVSCTLSN